MHSSSSVLLNITESNMSLTLRWTILCATNKENMTILHPISDRLHHDYNHVKMLKMCSLKIVKYANFYYMPRYQIHTYIHTNRTT